VTALDNAPVVAAAIERLGLLDGLKEREAANATLGLASMERVLRGAEPDKKRAALRIMLVEVRKWTFIQKPDLVDAVREVALACGLNDLEIQQELAEAFTDPVRRDADDEIDAITRGEPPGKIAARTPQYPGNAVNHRQVAVEKQAEFVCLDDVPIRPIDWLWRGRLARGKATLLAGLPDVGKSHIYLDIAARISTGAAWPAEALSPGGSAPLGSVIILSAEDAADDTLKPRLVAAGGDPGRIYVLKAIREGGKRRTFSLQADLDLISNKISTLGDSALVVIDPVTSYLGKTDSHRTSDVRGALEPLGEFATATGVAVLLISHPPKVSTTAINSVTGSLAFVAAPRLVFISVEEAGASGRRNLLAVKNNLGRRAPGLGYRLIQTTVGKEIVASLVAWDTDPVHQTADEALATNAAEAKGGGGAIRTARDFLSEVLRDGPQPTEAVEKMAKERGISDATLRNARKLRGVKAFRTGGLGKAGAWSLRLPP